MATPEELAAYLVKSTAAIMRLDLTLGPQDESFRQLAIGDIVDGVPVIDPWDQVQNRLLCGEDPVGSLSQAFAEQATAYSEAAVRVAIDILSQAIRHLNTAAGHAAATAFLEDLYHGRHGSGPDDSPAEPG